MTASTWLRRAPPAQPPNGGPHAPPWRVLLVDDAPEVHEVTRLVLADTAFSGRSIELSSVHSAAEARAWLAAHPGTALILLDVVMEADDAGLQLVRHIREVLRDRDVQIVLRTGQPGMAPERDVIARYDINGYYLKTELTAQKLTSIVVTGLRAYETIRTLREANADREVPPAVNDVRRERIGAELREALRRGAVTVRALPQVELNSGVVRAVELKCEWMTSEGPLDTANIAALIDDDVLLESLDASMLERACALARSYRDADAAPAPRVSLPLVSLRRDDSLTQAFAVCMSAAGIDGRALDLQVSSETLAARRMAARALQAMGVSITLTDLGLDRIALTDLQALQPDRIKIHARFVRDVARDSERAVVARAIVALAHTLGVVAIAEGVSSSEDLQFFRWEGCDLGQGDALDDVAGG
ncbi:EAL domain-containing protein [Caballeronia sp. LZ034LL]|uniref:EAL domain-containing response regulator n=1 Tax=Caballeronia sp. LZ034LL TaxID=3038567 RepID=UPI00285D22D2|nr:EAL domain-containing protein [Caballeronia sp. LZ034LL]MDR5833906.1 EAL domain-containing protein [Caballeronia sp. LZ034LL]